MTPLRAFYPPAELTPFDRRMIGDIIEQLVEVLDLAAGGFDLEDDDHSGDALDVGEGEQEYELRPVYGLDQSLGPINEHAASGAYQAAMMQ